jgi:hypothetical protein
VAADLAADTSTLLTERRPSGWLLSLVQGSQERHRGASTAGTDKSPIASAVVQAETVRHEEHTVDYRERLAVDLPLDLVPAVRLRDMANVQMACCKMALADAVCIACTEHHVHNSPNATACTSAEPHHGHDQVPETRLSEVDHSLCNALRAMRAIGSVVHRGLSATGMLEALCQLVVKQQQQGDDMQNLGYAHDHHLIRRLCHDHLRRLQGSTPQFPWLRSAVRPSRSECEQ